ncbi:50S ribosomal protein L29 [Candidatus Poriferisodalis sp.]|uniref:50S ribosomal protein L29 n=1 Tax=Candidatus Poriferisodalis sp. TaxID=3101277 RepID=UPI003B010BB9
MATAATLRGLSDDQLLDELASAKREMFNLRFSFATGELDSSAQMTATKRDVARILTVLREREIAAAEMLAGASQGAAAEMLAGASQGSAAEMLAGASQGSAAGLADTGVAS